MKEKLWNFIKSPKNWIIIALVILLGLFGLFGGRAVSKYDSEITELKSHKKYLELQMKLRDDEIKVQEQKIADKQTTIDSCMNVFNTSESLYQKIKREKYFSS